MRYCLGDKESMRPPELLTRDHVARCIRREVKEGRGSPHGGVYLDVSWLTKPGAFDGYKDAGWVKSRIGNAAERIRKKLPSMYHQFKELGGLDITTTAMEVGPTTHYVMGGVRVDSDTQMSRVPGLFAAGECAAGINGANRLGGNSLSDLLVFGKRAGEYAAKYAKEHPAGSVHPDQAAEAQRWALAFIDSPAGDENPYKVQYDLQLMMQDLVGIVRTEPEMLKALDGLKGLNERTRTVRAVGNREYNPGWHTCMDLRNLMIVSEAVARAAIERRESRGAQFRDDFQAKDDAQFGKRNTVIWRGDDGGMQLRWEPIPDMPADLKAAIEEQK
jgi:succinate dehydrogenase / fumarate reductase flavoprotein subunit